MSVPLVPASEATVYLAFEDFGEFGRAFVETHEDKADRETIIQNILSGQYGHLLRVVAFNTAEGWSRDVTQEIAQEVAHRREALAAH
jgi:hypothetical protein